MPPLARRMDKAGLVFLLLGSWFVGSWFLFLVVRKLQSGEN